LADLKRQQEQNFANVKIAPLELLEYYMYFATKTFSDSCGRAIIKIEYLEDSYHIIRQTVAGRSGRRRETNKAVERVNDSRESESHYQAILLFIRVVGALAVKWYILSKVNPTRYSRQVRFLDLTKCLNIFPVEFLWFAVMID
jgi:hypothetical protein